VALETARQLDAQDQLSSFRTRFSVSDPSLIYLDGNSLGRLPSRTSEVVQDLVQRQWGERLIRGWGEGWIDLPQRLGAKIAKLIGAEPDEVVVTDSTSVNFFKLAMAALEARPGRRRVVTEATNFPSDLYLLQGCTRLLGEYEIARVESEDGIVIQPGRIEAELDERTALLTLSHTAFKSGFVHDMGRLTSSAHDAGALVLWDLSHSVGAMPLQLRAQGVDLAVGCCYKYLNGGPGAPAFLYVRREMQEELLSPIWGWFGQRDAFDFGLDYRPAEGVARFLAGTPPVLSMAAIEPGVDLLLEAGMDRVRDKSLRMTEYLIENWAEYLAPLGVTLNSPRDPSIRGSHVSLGHPEGLRIDRALIERMNVIPDFRYPDNIRFGVAPLYNTFEDVYEGIDRMRRVIEDRVYEEFSLDAPKVT
jgi:kynureninase